MTVSLIAPVIPPNRSGRGGRGDSRRVRLTAPPHLADPPLRPAAPPELSYRIGRIDASGRVTNRSVIAALAWSSGDRLPLTAEAGVMVARRDPSGMVTLPPQLYIVIPAALRHRCGLCAGDLVLLAASPSADMLAAYPFALVDQAIRLTFRSMASLEAPDDGYRSRCRSGASPRAVVDRAGRSTAGVRRKIDTPCHWVLPELRLVR